MRFGFATALAWLVAGCAPVLGTSRDPTYQGNGPGAMRLPPATVYQDSTGPLSYRSPIWTAGQARPVEGRACQSALTLPVGLIFAAVEAGNTAYASAYLSGALGEGGYADALADASTAAPGAQLVDVRADLNTRIILGIWRQQCVRITATAVSPPPTNPDGP